MFFCSNPFLIQELYSKTQSTNNQKMLAKLSDNELEQTAIQLSLLRKELQGNSGKLLREKESELAQELKLRQQIAEFKKNQFSRIESTFLDSFVTCPDTLTVLTKT